MLASFVEVARRPMKPRGITEALKRRKSNEKRNQVSQQNKGSQGRRFQHKTVKILEASMEAKEATVIVVSMRLAPG
jgi:hypothetical protein